MPFDPASLLDVSHFVTFVGGAAVGAAGQYFADRLTDQRRRQEERSAVHKRFTDVQKTMPALLSEMALDLKNNPTASIRELVVLPSKNTNYWSPDNAIFVYYVSEHPHLENHVEVLAANGFVDNVTATNVPKYRLREQFVALLQEHA